MSYEDGTHPTVAIILGVLAGLLVLIDGVLLGVAGSIAGSRGDYAIAGLVGALGLLGDLFGLVLLGLTYGLIRDPESHVGIGIGLIIVGVLSIFGGGGFIIGTILAVVAGILAIVYAADDGEPLPGYGSPPTAPWTMGPAAPPTSPWSPTPAPAVPAGAPAASPSPVSSPVPGGKTCPSCGTSFDRSRLFCPQCGAPAP